MNAGERFTYDVRPLAWAATPEHAVRAWPRERPLIAFVGDRSEWSILAPADGERRALGGADPLGPLDAALELSAAPAPAALAPLPSGAPLLAGWAVALPYELGAHLEPAAGDAGAIRDACAVRIDAAFLHHGPSGRWWAAGRSGALGLLPDITPSADNPAAEFTAGPLRSDAGRDRFVSAAAAAVERIRAGDVYQVNLSHALRGPFTGSARALLGAIVREASPSFAAIFELPECAVVSMSPELFLRGDLSRDGPRHIVTMPIKGTAPARSGAERLARSEKDAAELAMIVDLMRNDLGRVCRVGSVRVDQPRAIVPVAGSRAGLLHGVATVSGTLRDDVSAGGLLRAAFPAGSITGAPKIMAMRIISALERRERGFYCGSLGFFADHGPFSLSVAIRTATIRGAEIEFPVGAGVVADSEPEAEWRETLDKAAAFIDILDRAGSPAPCGATA